MIEAILIVGTIIAVVLIACLVFLVLQYSESRKTNILLIKDSTQAYLDAIQGQKTKKPVLSPTRNGVPIQDNRKVEIDKSDGTNLLEMDPEEAYQAIMGTMGVVEDKK